jgi:hypothetical protein
VEAVTLGVGIVVVVAEITVVGVVVVKGKGLPQQA